MLKVNITLALILLIVSCSQEEEHFEVLDPEKIQKEHETKYNNEYIKIIEKDAGKDQPKRMINADAPLHLGSIEVTTNNETKKFHTFKKGGSHLSLSEKGLRLTVNDMYNARFVIFLGNNAILKNAVNTYTPSEEPLHLQGSIDYYDKIEGKEVHYQWISGKAKLSEFSAGLGTVKLSVTGKATELNAKKTVDFNIEFALNIEEVTSSVNPNNKRN